MLGHDQFEFEWISIYKFQCRRMQRFVHERVIFAGDAVPIRYRRSAPAAPIPGWRTARISPGSCR